MYLVVVMSVFDEPGVVGKLSLSAFNRRQDRRKRTSPRRDMDVFFKGLETAAYDFLGEDFSKHVRIFITIMMIITKKTTMRIGPQTDLK